MSEFKLERVVNDTQSDHICITSRVYDRSYTLITFITRHALTDATSFNETPLTPFMQLMIQTFPMFGRENVYSMPQCVVHSTQKMGLSSS
jgi:hypothetical protein